MNFLLYILSLVLLPFVYIAGFVFNVIHKSIYGGLSDYFMTLAIGNDQLGGSALYGTEDWTISSHTYYLSLDYKSALYFMYFIDFCFDFVYFVMHLKWVRQHHCRVSYETEEKEGKV